MKRVGRPDPELVREALSIVRSRGIRLSRERGQHVMVSREALEAICSAAEPISLHRVLEIGPGFGFLTEEILRRGPSSLLAVELDPAMVEVLRSRLGGRRGLRIVLGDGLRYVESGEYDLLISNPPFSVSSRLILGLIDADFRSASITLQSEFVRRLTARPGTDFYGSMSVLAQLRFRIEPIALVRRDAFLPPPRVSVTLVRLEPRGGLLRELGILKRVLPSIFSRRKRKVGRVLDAVLKSMGIPEGLSGLPLRIDPEERVYKISPEKYLEIAREIREVLG